LIAEIAAEFKLKIGSYDVAERQRL